MKAKLGVALVLLLALVPLVPLPGCGSDSGTHVSVSDNEKALIQEFVAAHVSDDKEALAALFAEDAILSDYIDYRTIEGRDAIVTAISMYPQLDWGISGEPIKVGVYLVQPMVMLAYGDPVGQGVQVFELNENGRIKHAWTSGLFNVSE